MLWVGPALVIAGYLLGAVPFGLLVSRAMGGPDPRQGGSGNIGATNVARQLGKTAGVLTLLLDIAKGLSPALLADHWLTPWWAGAVGLAAFIGHCWPVYLRFRGGKGVATFLGVLFGLAPWAGSGHRPVAHRRGHGQQAHVSGFNGGLRQLGGLAVDGRGSSGLYGHGRRDDPTRLLQTPRKYGAP